MDKDLYLENLTYAEYFGITMQKFSNYSNEKILEGIEFMKSEIPDSNFWHSYQWPKEINLSDNPLKSFQEQVKDIKFSTDYFPNKNSSQVHEDWAYELKPERTFERSNGDCKCLAVMAVTYMRDLGIPTRIYIPSENHVIVESYDLDDRGFWERWDPDPTICSVQGFSPKGEFDKFYENLLKIIKEKIKVEPSYL